MTHERVSQVAVTKKKIPIRKMTAIVKKAKKDKKPQTKDVKPAQVDFLDRVACPLDCITCATRLTALGITPEALYRLARGWAGVANHPAGCQCGPCMVANSVKRVFDALGAEKG